MIEMNNKGFTLVELLATIVVISIILTIVSISVGPIVKKYEKNLSKTQISIIEEAANVYYLKEGIKNSYENRSFKICVNLDYLIKNDYIEDESVKSIYDNEKLEGSVEITYKSDEHTYKYKENSCTYEYQAIDSICTAVTDETKTTGNIPTGKYLPGDEYICEVKNNTKYHFFVLNTEKDQVNLILDRNINSDGTVATKAISVSDKELNDGIYNLMAWINQDDYESKGGLSWTDSIDNNIFGPITAMNFLNNATSDWNNIPNLNIIYNDEGGNFTNFLVTGKARLPQYNEVIGKEKCTTDFGSCPLWLSNYLDIGNEVTEKEIQKINAIFGYWTFSSRAGTTYDAWLVFPYGFVYGYVGSYNVSYNYYFGVRPVITIPKLDIAN